MDYNNHNMNTPPYYGGNQSPHQYGGSEIGVTRQTNAVMKRVYVRMFIGLLISAFCAMGVASSPSLLMLFYGSKITYFVLFGVMLVMAWVLPARMNKMSTGAVLGCFLVFSALMGISLAPIFVLYTVGTIVYTFFITAGTFGAMSVYGYFTKADLTKIGSFLIMALFGLIIATIVNIFVANSTLDWVISIVGVLIFVGLTAWDTQAVKQMSRMNLDPAMADKLATMGALNLYLDFVNLFLYILRFVGSSRD